MIEAVNYHYLWKSNNVNGNYNTCLFQIMLVNTTHRKAKPLIVFFDVGATISLFTFTKAAMLNLQGNEVNIPITRVGGSKETISSYQYILPLVDKNRDVVEIEVYGIDKIVKRMDIKGVIHLFGDIKDNEIQRPVGDIDVLMGFEYAGFHPVKEKGIDHLLLMSIW